MTSVQLAAARAANEGWDSDGSLSWEDFFGTSTDLAPSLLGMYDQLIGRVPQKGTELSAVSVQHKRPAPPPQQAQHAQHRIMEVVISDVVPRPLSVSSIASSSSSSSSGTSSCSGGGGGGGGGRLGGAPKSSAYLASIESLEDDDSDDDVADRDRQKAAVDRLKGSITSQGSADSGVGSPCSFISSPSPPQGRPRYCDPHLSYMDRVVMEIVETEGVYVKDLEQVIQGYLEKWRAALDPSIGERHLSDLFSNIEPIYQFNSGFLAQLERCGLDPVQVARCFVRNNAGFAVYTQYCTNYPRTVSVLTELMRQDATVRLFRERQAALQHTLPLGSYLLKPVQRILKYHLLLQNLVKHYACEAEGYSDIVDALSAMTGIAHHINDMKRRHEHSVRVQEIQSLLYSWEGEDLTTYGELCAEGAFRMSGAKALRHAFLFDKMLLITKKKEEATLGYKAHIMCSNLMLIESVPGEPLSFHVIPFDNPRLQYTLQARNLEQKREWTLQLKRVILENYNAVIPSHARQLVMELGQNRTDDDILAEKGTPKRQHSAPEYLEKRKQDRDRRKSETGLRYRLRRSRKSECGSNLESPLPHHRGRRASSNSHERSPSREGLRSASPISVKERFGSWRRKSEPSCHSPLSGNKPQPPKLSVAPEQDLNPAPSDNKLPQDLNLVTPTEPPQNPSPEPDSDVGTCEDSPQREMPSDTLHDDDETKTLEEIVGQLLLQNREFQKILKKQQRTVGLRARRDETTDTEAEEEPRGAAAAYRAHRHAHTRALRTQQKAFAGLTKFQRRVVANADEEEQVAPPGDPLRGETWDDVRHGENDSKSVTDEGFGNYDNLQNIWESVQKQQEEIRRLAESTERECRPPTVDLAAEPTSPAVWLKQQSRHLASPTKKSGSLPRSFQLTPEPSAVNVQTALAAAQRGKRGDRPFTIASDKLAEIDLDDIERYVAESAAARAAHRFPVGGDTTEEDSMTEYTATPGASMNDLNVHPEYKIYRPSVSRAALKHVLSSVRLGGTRTSSETLDDREHRASKFVYALARQYSKTLKERIKNIMGEHNVGSRIGSEEFLDLQRTPSPVPLLPTPVLPTYKQGSSGLGARIAQSEYANPRLLFPHIHAKGNVRPDSLLSASSHFTSSSEGEKTSDPTAPVRLPEDASDGSNDGYYERSFEAIESLCEHDAFRDSAVFSDHEDSLDTSSCAHLHRNISIESKISLAKNGKVPPPVPAKPNGLKKTNAKSAVVDRVTIQEKEQHLVRGLEGISKSIRDRRRELELWRANKEKSAEEEGDTSSQHSAASTVIEVGKEEEGTPRGWVRHVIGKLQKATADDDDAL